MRPAAPRRIGGRTFASGAPPRINVQNSADQHQQHDASPNCSTHDYWCRPAFIGAGIPEIENDFAATVRPLDIMYEVEDLS